MNLPEYNSNRQLGEKGVTIVKNIVESKLDWIFRKVSLDDDFGIDGYIDILEDKKYVTGKSIAIQIKTGESYFTNLSQSGWIYYGENKHLNYYMNIDTPVIIALVNPKTQQVYWSEFDINIISKTKMGWKLLIKKNQILEEKQKLKSITNLAIDYTSQLENLTQINKKMIKSKIIFVAVGKEEIIEKNYNGFKQILKWLTASDEMIRKCQGKLIISVFGYDEDVRGLYQIEEVRTWMQGVLPIFKYWGYFLNMELPKINLTSLCVLLLCNIELNLLEYDEIKKSWKTEYDLEESAEFKKQIFHWLNEFADNHNIEEKIVFEQSMKIMKIIDKISDEDVIEIRKKYGFS